MNKSLTLIAALTPPGVPLVMWAYLALALVYQPTVVWVWRQETVRAGKREVQGRI